MQHCDLYLGRFQPFHNGHLAAVKLMGEKKVIAVVQGKYSSEKDNPIPVSSRVNIIKKVVPDAEVMHVENGYVPDMIQKIKDCYNLGVARVICGEDRIGQYQAQIIRANKTLDVPLNVEFMEAERITSGSEVREAIRSGDNKAFKANVPKELWDEFTNLAELMRGKSNE